MKSKQSGLIICGTGTDVGKTIISALLVQGLGGIYWKPIQSGLDEDGDTGRVCRLLKLPSSRWIPEAYKFQAPVSPHWAAEKEGQLIDQKRLEIPVVNRPLIVETAGGLMVPLTRHLLQIDQLQYWQLPILLVARTELGTLNHTLLSLEALKTRNIPVIGLFLNGPDHLDNPTTLEQFGNIPIIGKLPPMREITSESLTKQWELQELDIAFKRLLQI